MDIQTLYPFIVDNLRDGVYYVDRKRTVLFWNKGAERISGYTADEIVGKICPETGLNHMDEECRPLCNVGCPLFASQIDGKQRQERVLLRHKTGYRIPVLVNIFPVRENDEIVGAVEIFTQDVAVNYDDTFIQHLSDISMHDSLTGLPNRRYLESFLAFHLNQFSLFGRKFAVLFGDIDKFSDFNNTYGHDVGDMVLKNIGETLRKFVHKDEMLGRWGGEEFLGIFPIVTEFDAPIIAEKIRRLIMNVDVCTSGRSLSVTMSIGITQIKPGDTLESIIKRADSHMYESKKLGRNRVTAD